MRRWIIAKLVRDGFCVVDLWSDTMPPLSRGDILLACI